MDQHLQEIEDEAARAGVNTFKTQMEIVILSLLDGDRAVALGQIEEARVVMVEHLKNISSTFAAALDETKAARVASGMLMHTFGRLRHVIEAPDDTTPVAVTPH